MDRHRQHGTFLVVCKRVLCAEERSRETATETVHEKPDRDGDKKQDHHRLAGGERPALRGKRSPLPHQEDESGTPHRLQIGQGVRQRGDQSGGTGRGTRSVYDSPQRTSEERNVSACYAREI